MAFVYILKLANDQYYVGSTYNLPHRIREHDNGQDIFTRRFLPVELKYFEEYETKEEAAKRERQIKGWSRIKKEKLISGEWGIQNCVYPELVEGTTMELALNMLAEATTVELSKSQNPKGFRQSAKVAHEGGKIAGETRAKIESQTGRSIVSKERASDYLPPPDRWEALPEEDKDE